MTDFARPTRLLHTGGDPAIPGARITPYPAAGQGFAVNAKGEVPTAVTAGQWTFELVTVSLDPSSLGAQAGETQNVTIPGLALNDICVYLGGVVTSALNIETHAICSTAGQITVNIFNTDNITVDSAAFNAYFLVIHRFING